MGLFFRGYKNTYFKKNDNILFLCNNKINSLADPTA
nr:MAG TPA: hypothetical protein [Caudoviricetes sp.]